LTLGSAVQILTANVAAKEHVFWNLDYSPALILPEIRDRIRGHRQVPDALLLDLAIRRKGRLVTFDQGIPHLLPLNSPHRAAIEIIK